MLSGFPLTSIELGAYRSEILIDHSEAQQITREGIVPTDDESPLCYYSIGSTFSLADPLILYYSCLFRVTLLVRFQHLPSPRGRRSRPPIEPGYRQDGGKERPREAIQDIRCGRRKCECGDITVVLENKTYGRFFLLVTAVFADVVSQQQ